MALVGDTDVGVMLALLGAPYRDDTVGTVLRLARALVRRGTRVEVWTCGYATFLTHRWMVQDKPVNVFDWDRPYPGAARLVQDALREADGLLLWSVCGFCTMERGSEDQVEEVSVPPGSSFGQHVARARTTLFIGTA